MFRKWDVRNVHIEKSNEIITPTYQTIINGPLQNGKHVPAKLTQL